MCALGYNLYWHCNFMHFYKYRCQAYCTWSNKKMTPWGQHGTFPGTGTTDQQRIRHRNKSSVFMLLQWHFNPFPSSHCCPGICMDIGNCKYTRVRLQLIIIQLHSVFICKKIFIFASQFLYGIFNKLWVLFQV